MVDNLIALKARVLQLISIFANIKIYKMDKQVKQQAVAKFSQLVQSGAALSTVREAIGKEFKGADIDEIVDALPKPDQGLPKDPNRPNQDLPGKGDANRPDQGLPDEEDDEKPSPKK
jgi:hypothetical protein